MSEYEPVFELRNRAPEDEDLARVRGVFDDASRPFLTSPWSWAAWALILPAAALTTPRAWSGFGVPGVLLCWSIAILLGGAVELAAIRRAGRRRPSNSVARWAFRAQGNLSLTALALSAAVVYRAPELARVLPGLWLLLLGHSFFVLGGLAFRPLRTAGVLYQLGGLVSLWPGLPALQVFALTAAAANSWIAWAVARRARREGQETPD